MPESELEEQKQKHLERQMMKDLIKSIVGDVSEMKALDEWQFQYLFTLCARDTINRYQFSWFTDESIDKLIGDGCEREITMIYLYCNWRVWATYQEDEPLARKYQDVCDYIDGRVFDAWKSDKDKINYFVRETD